MPRNSGTGGIHLHDLKEYTGSFSWDPYILRHNIEFAIPGYSYADPATWPRISRDTIRRSDGQPYDGSMALPGGVAAFDEDVISLFLSNVAKDWSFKATVSAHGQSNPNSTIRCGFRDFPFVFAQAGTLKKKSRWCNMPLTVRENYVKLLGPCQSAPMNDVRSSLLAQQGPSSNQQLSPHLDHHLPPRPGPLRYRSLSQGPNVKETQHEDIDPGSRMLPKSSEEAYRELLGMLEGQSPDMEEPQETELIVAQNVSQANDAESVSKAAFLQCESAVKQLTDLAHLEFYALRAELDEKVKGFDDKMRKLEQRAIAAEEKSSVLEKHLESNQRVISDLNARIVVANEKALSACNNALAADMERKASDRRVADLEQQLRLGISDLAAAKKQSKQADERLMTLWAAMEKSRSSASTKRKETTEPPGLMEADATRDRKRARKDRQVYAESDHGNIELDVPSAHDYSGDSVLDVSGVSVRSTSPTVVKTEDQLLRSALLWHARGERRCIGFTTFCLALEIVGYPPDDRLARVLHEA
ncbi:hypothetical protein P171DRAFT_517098 [Karstenula rhodostoma CBS 690.94]|uniref:Uncharacterized protein n=1 Tax=Karstenula rhodostoma CBS 690.94 TaxID=1392251 RepID=A0A9P4PV66_9PLEO|nr:hypothetical protein P171DRAFT_517098 [Karstenula rhodostoma CBS 690.94]